MMRVSFLTAVTLCFLVTSLVPARASAQSEVVEYYALDAIGSVRVVFDSSGAIKSRRDYAPFGEVVTSITADPKMYAGLFRDDESTLDYAQARMYQSGTGRFTAVDPVYSGLFNPQGWNRYSYAANSALNFVDPEGLQFRTTSVPGCQTFDCGALGYFFPPIYGDLPGWFSFDDSAGTAGGTTPRGGGGGQRPSPAPPAPGPTPTHPVPVPNPPDSDPQPPTLLEEAPSIPTWKRALECASAQVGLSDLLAVGGVAAGQPIPGTKRLVIPGSSRGTSPAGMAADRLFGDARLPVRVPTIVGGPGTGRAFAIAGTTSVARAAGRAVPIVGWAVLAYDAASIAACTIR